MNNYTYKGQYLLRGLPYEGPICIGPDEQIYTGTNFIYGKSEILTKVSNLNFTRDSIQFYKEKLVPPFAETDQVYPLTYYPKITKRDIKTGYITRYFVYDLRYPRNIIEVSVKNYKQLSNSLYKKISLDWKISGIRSQVETVNITTLNNIYKLIPELKNKFFYALELFVEEK